MPKYIIKPTQVEAIQYQWDDEIGSQEEAEDNIADFINQNIKTLSDHEMILIEVLGEEVHVERGDWIIKIGDEVDVLSADAFQENFAPFDTWIDRVRFEQSIVGANTAVLSELVTKDRPNFIDEKQWALMNRQAFHQSKYNDILLDRIELGELDLTDADKA